MSEYNSLESAQSYLEFLDSERGQLQQKLLTDHIVKRLPQDPSVHILDAGCGNGWLLNNLSGQYHNIQGIEISENLIKNSKERFANLKISQADFTKALPYSSESFDVVILNMTLTDTSRPGEVFKNLSAILKPGGIVLVTLPNPYYANPIGSWKRSLWEYLSFQKPSLKLANFYNQLGNEGGKRYQWKLAEEIHSFFHPMQTYINSATENGLALFHWEDFKNSENAAEFGLKYQLFRFPVLILLEFKKI